MQKKIFVQFNSKNSKQKQPWNKYEIEEKKKRIEYIEKSVAFDAEQKLYN